MYRAQPNPSPSTPLQWLVRGLEHHLDVDVLGHPIDQPMRLRQTGAPGKDQLDAGIVAHGLATPKVAEVIVLDHQLAQSPERVGDVNIFLGRLQRKLPQQPFRREIFKRLSLCGGKTFLSFYPRRPPPPSPRFSS